MALPTGAISLLRSSMTRHGARSIFPMTGVLRALSGRSIPVRPGNCRGGAGHGIVVRSVSATLTSENAFSSRSTEPCLFSTVWCNGRLAGGWPYGYTSYRVDLTPCLVPGDNTLAIRLDNPPESSRWYPGGGIYRNVWLTKSDPVGIAHWGTFCNPRRMSPPTVLRSICASSCVTTGWRCLLRS